MSHELHKKALDLVRNQIDLQKCDASITLGDLAEPIRFALLEVAAECAHHLEEEFGTEGWAYANEIREHFELPPVRLPPKYSGSIDDVGRELKVWIETQIANGIRTRYEAVLEEKIRQAVLRDRAERR